MNHSLIIRADVTTRMGIGHIMRCIALGQAWQDQKGSVTFLSHCDSKTLRHRIIDEGFDFIPIEKPHPDPDDLRATLEVLSDINDQLSGAGIWLALDGYHFTPDYQKEIRVNGYKLLVIDDIAHLDYYHADVLLNQNINASSYAYPCDCDTVKLLGCEYVLLRREFQKYKKLKQEIPHKARKILVTLGGSDPDNVTLKVVKALNSLNDPNLEVKIVAGPANQNISSFEKELRHSLFTFQLLSSQSNMPELMAWADVAVAAAGSTCWELAYMGVPSITVVTAENQIDVAMGLERTKIFNTIGWCKAGKIDLLVDELSVLMEDKHLREVKGRFGRQLVNGNGAKNIVGTLSKRCDLKH